MTKTGVAGRKAYRERKRREFTMLTLDAKFNAELSLAHLNSAMVKNVDLYVKLMDVLSDWLDRLKLNKKAMTTEQRAVA